MQLIINGKPLSCADGYTVADLLAELGYQDLFLAVAVNRACVRRLDYTSTTLRDGDDIEILAPMAGG